MKREGGETSWHEEGRREKLSEGVGVEQTGVGEEQKVEQTVEPL
jgi:hypothetical protein